MLWNRDDDGEPVVCFQWFNIKPVREGTVLVLRYRARADDGAGRLSVGPRMPLTLPAAESGRAAARLRRAAPPHETLEPRPGEEVLDYRLTDRVQPGPDWQSYYTVWEWPPFARDASCRNIVIEYAGAGQVRVEQVEVFPWELPSGP